MSRFPVLRRRRTLAGLVAGGVLVTGSLLGTPPAAAAEPFDPEVVLPARVDVALHRTYGAVQRATAAIDDGRVAPAIRSLKAAARGFARSYDATARQVAVVPDPNAEEESTAGPDSALAALNVSQVSIVVLASLFDGVDVGPAVVNIRAALASAQKRRADLVGLITQLDPEEAGAPYADALADTVSMYTDEVAALEEALDEDELSPAGRTALTAALERSRAAEATMLAAFGGGE